MDEKFAEALEELMNYMNLNKREKGVIGATEGLRRRPAFKFVPEEVWQSGRGNAMDSRCYYLGGYVVRTAEQEADVVRGERECWLKNHGLEVCRACDGWGCNTCGKKGVMPTE